MLFMLHRNEQQLHIGELSKVAHTSQGYEPLQCKKRPPNCRVRESFFMHIIFGADSSLAAINVGMPHQSLLIGSVDTDT